MANHVGAASNLVIAINNIFMYTPGVPACQRSAQSNNEQRNQCVGAHRGACAEFNGQPLSSSSSSVELLCAPLPSAERLNQAPAPVSTIHRLPNIEFQKRTALVSTDSRR
ncbi:hypothetical protein NX059_009242 [Plenodomus lindquistii]|nr:hypothetical protein NX059_009242 [Plenodomus lindquistii]